MTPSNHHLWFPSRASKSWVHSIQLTPYPSSICLRISLVGLKGNLSLLETCLSFPGAKKQIEATYRTQRVFVLNGTPRISGGGASEAQGRRADFLFWWFGAYEGGTRRRSQPQKDGIFCCVQGQFSGSSQKEEEEEAEEEEAEEAETSPVRKFYSFCGQSLAVFRLEKKAATAEEGN